MLLRIVWSERATTELETFSDPFKSAVRIKLAELASVARPTPTRKPRTAHIPRVEIVYRIDTNTQELLVESVRLRKPSGRSSSGGGKSTSLLG